ncbi:remorin 1.4-like [Aristolochia californica]|uniref:remorin 1.4-like n=1 Tax=Aristolochia californica TaxID=171875 RepID=UPI0035DD88E1
MELMKQMRVRFSGLGQDSQDLSSTRERRIPPQKTQSFKTEKKTQNWFWRQMSRDADTSDDIEFKTAVAAAAFAIASLEEADQLNKQKRRVSSTGAVETSLDKTKTKKEEQSTAKTSRRLTIKEVKEDSKSSTGGASMKKPEATDKKMAEKIPTTQKVPNYPEEKEKGTSSMKHISAKDTRPFPDTKPTTPISSNQQKESSKEKGKMVTQADTWERIKLTKIQKSYEKVKSSILSWEGERKAKARRQLDKRERELETKRANASHEYHMEIARIEKIAAEARAVAEEKKRKDEKKTKEKAMRFRSTGKPPVTCFFF